jgi:hypothetical protein
VVCDEQEKHWLSRDQKAVHKEAWGKKMAGQKLSLVADLFVMLPSRTV